MSNEGLISVDVSAGDRLKLYNQVTAALTLKGSNVEAEGINWILDAKRELLLSDLVLFANKFKLKIIISNFDFVV